MGSGGRYSPGPATATPLALWGDRWMALSRHPEPCADPHPSSRVSPARGLPFARRACRRFHPPTFAPR